MKKWLVTVHWTYEGVEKIEVEAPNYHMAISKAVTTLRGGDTTVFYNGIKTKAVEL